jgi:hypothetical protein
MFSREDLLRHAARTSVKFLRRQADTLRPENKDSLVRIIWKLYFKARKANMLAAPHATRRLLRRQYGFYRVVGVVNPIH